MRCQSIRSLLRASLVAGLIASCQNGALTASWKDCLHPIAGTCFVHDLQWEQSNFQTNCGEYSSKSILTSDSEIVQTSDPDTDLCIAAAEKFEFRMQADAVFAALRSQSNQLFEAGAKIFQSYSRSRRMIISSIDSQSLKLVEWIKVANSFPPIVVELQGDQDLECGWECGEWSRHVPHSVSNILPYRGCANVFVYSLDDSTELLDSNSTYSIQPSICCPQDTNPEDIDLENTTSLTVISIRPPTLDAEYESRVADTQEDLAVASKFASEILAIEIKNLDKVSKPIGMPFSSKDFLTTLHASTYGSILLPVSNSHRLAVDYAMNVISPTYTQARSQMSKGVTSQIRTVGQFLVEFANQIENRIEQVEIARRDNIQR